MVIRLFTTGVYTLWQYWVPVWLWLAGGILGGIALEFDRLLDIYISNPDNKLSIVVKDYFKLGKYQQGWIIINKNRHLQIRLTFHSALFQVVWVFLVLFTLTSTFASFGKGFVLGLGLNLLLDEWEDYRQDKQFLKKWLFWQINREVSDKELRSYLLVMTILTTVFFLLIIRGAY